MLLKSVALISIVISSLTTLVGCSRRNNENEQQLDQEYKKLMKIIKYLSVEKNIIHYNSTRNGKKDNKVLFLVANRDVNPNFDAFPESCLFFAIRGAESTIPYKFGKRPISDSLSMVFSKPYNVSSHDDWDELSTSENADNIVFLKPLNEVYIYCVVMHDRGDNLSYSSREKYISYSGLSLSYLFTFNDEGNIKHVCFGETENRSK